MKRVKLPFIPGLEVEFVNREYALKQVERFSEKGTRYPIVVFGPEGCGKTALLKQTTEVLRELGFDVIYIDPLRRDFIAYTDIGEVVRKLREVAVEAIGIAQLKLATLALDIVKDLISVWRRKYVAVLVDEVFQAIGLDKAETYVKSLLGLIEYPPNSYEKIVAIIATSEGLTRSRIGRHRWALLRPIWNMSKRGLEELYEKIPGFKPKFEDIWMLTGGNPDILSKLYQANWNVEKVITEYVKSKEITPSFIVKWRNRLEEAIRDPDILWDPSTPEELIRELIAKNLIIYNLYDRDAWFWIDEPPPEKDLELGIGRYVAWQTPLHKEAVKKVLIEMS